MEWIGELFQPEVLVLILLIVVIVGAFIYAAMAENHKHQERLEKLKQGFNPDQ